MTAAEEDAGRKRWTSDRSYEIGNEPPSAEKDAPSCWRGCPIETGTGLQRHQWPCELSGTTTRVGRPADKESALVRVVGLALDEFDQVHEYPVETDDGMVMRCACGARPPSHLLGQQVDESMWLWEHWRAERRTHVAATLAVAGIGVIADAKAEAWDEGYDHGIADGQMPDGWTCAANPYRVESEAGR